MLELRSLLRLFLAQLVLMHSYAEASPELWIPYHGHLLLRPLCAIVADRVISSVENRIVVVEKFGRGRRSGVNKRKYVAVVVVFK